MPVIDFPGRGPIQLPAQFKEFRPHQVDAVDEALDFYAEGYDIVILDAPTGSGKTLIGETTRILHDSAKALYLCTTKGLQDQFVSDFPDAKLIKGRANYPTLDNPSAFKLGLDASVCVLTTKHVPPPMCQACEFDDADETYADRLALSNADSVDWRHCDFCHAWQQCPYRVAKKDALTADLAVANTAYFLHESNNVGGFSGDRFIIVDEADTLESLLMSFMSVSISRNRLDRIGIDQPKLKTVASSWLPWTKNAVGKLGDSVGALSQAISLSEGPHMYGLVRERDRVSKLQSGIARFSQELSIDPDNWVYDGSSGGVQFKPIEVDRFGKKVLWSHAKNFMLMSATIIADRTMMSFLGYDKKFATVTVDSNFPPEKRPVWICGAANMSYKTRDAEWPKMVDAVEAVLIRHPDLRILVHTVSYKFTDYLLERLKARGHGARLFSYRNAGQRDSTLEEFRHSEAGVVLAPSFDRGVDLPDGDARVIVVTKVPFPNLTNQQVSSRLFGTGISGQTWYSMETIRSLVQMTGRGMRHKDDWCISYILDSQFNSIVWPKKILIPKWWKASIKWGPPVGGGALSVTSAAVPARLG